jgi:aldehyde dehydrogenase (NAD+)
MEATATTELNYLLEEQQALSPALARTTARDRAAKIDRITDYLDRKANLDRLLNALHRDLRKHEVETLTSEVGIVYTHATHIKKHLKRWMEPRRVPTPLSLIGTRSYIYPEPKGCVLVIAPWNYPFNLAVLPVLYAIAAGCTVVLKPSEYSPATTTYLQEMFSELFPANEITVVEGEGDTAAALTKMPFNHIFFTGSPAIGKKVMAAAAENLASVTLELGGKSPCLVQDDVDIDKSARSLAWGKFFNAGQTCIAPDYLLVNDNIVDTYVAALGKALDRAYGEDPRQSEDLARIVNEKQFDHLVALLEDAVGKGATVACGGQHHRDGRYFAPTVLTGVTRDMRVMQEEIFGPLLPVLDFNNLNEALSIVNGLPKPLAFYIQTHDRATIKRLLADTSAGGTLINEFLIGPANPALPFGGVNNSGIGKSYGHHGFLEFTNERGVMERRFFDLSVAYPPYTDRVKNIVRRIFRWS